jgi:hypothetical protein
MSMAMHSIVFLFFLVYFLVVPYQIKEILHFNYTVFSFHNVYVTTTLLNPQKLALTSPTSYGRSAGIVHSRTQATELLLVDAYKMRLSPDFQFCILINPYLLIN